MQTDIKDYKTQRSKSTVNYKILLHFFTPKLRQTIMGERLPETSFILFRC